MPDTEHLLRLKIGNLEAKVASLEASWRRAEAERHNMACELEKLREQPPDTVTLTRAQIRQLARDAINLYTEYVWNRERPRHQHRSAQEAAIAEVEEGAFAALPTPEELREAARPVPEDLPL